MAKIFGFLTLVACLWGCQYVSGGEPGAVSGRVTFLDVGQGLAVLLEHGGRYGLYDAGPDSAGLADSLRGRGVDTLDWVLLSHNHRDHFGGLLELLRSDSAALQKGAAIHVAHLMVGPDTARFFLVDSVLRVARRLDIPVDTVGRGDRIYLGGGIGGLRLDVLWPPLYRLVGENGASVVARVGLAGESLYVSGKSGGVLLTGDLDSLGESRLQEINADVSAELLQVGHHGSAHSSTLGFLNRVSPRYAVVSVGADNSYGHPADPVLQKLQYVLGDSSAVCRTDRDGSVAYLLVPDVGLMPEK